MTEPPPRKRFQIHLSTAIVLMVVAGVLMWANTSERVTPKEGIMTNEGRVHIHHKFNGWPYDAVERYFLNNRPLPLDLKKKELFINLAVAVAILFATWFICEWLIRRRAARKES